MRSELMLRLAFLLLLSFALLTEQSSLSRTMSKVEALRQAQLELTHFSPFLLGTLHPGGRWQVKLPAR